MDMSFIDSKMGTLAPKYKNLSLFGIIGMIFSIILLLALILIDPRLDKKVIHYKNIYLHRHCSPGTYYSSTICTDGCRIPLLAEEDDSFQKLWIKQYNQMTQLQSCRSNPLLGSNRTHIWVEKKNMHYYNLSSSSKFTCCYRSFYREEPRSDISDFINMCQKYHQIIYNDCRDFTETIKVHSDDEFVRVTCTENATLFDSYFAFAPEKKPAKPNDLPYNVLILGIDGVSRLNFHRTMPETLAYLKKLGAIELMGYNKVGDNTFPNLIPLLTGMTEQDLERTCLPCQWHPFDECPFIWKQFQKAGFLTALAEDSSSLGTFSLNRLGFKETPTDYYFNPFITEAENNAANNVNDYIMLCMNEKFFFKLLLDYVEDLTKLKNKLFGFFWEVTMTHQDLFFPMMMDDSYSQFFRRLNASGYLNNSIIFLVSDHGIRFGAFRQTKQGFLEERLPFVFALMPPSFRNNYDLAYNNLKLNSRHLTTPFDFHATLADLVNLDNIKNEAVLSRSRYANYNRGISLFLPISGQRTCESAGIDDHWCTCYKNAKMRLNDPDGREAVRHTISYLNGLLEDHPQCSKLTLAHILEVTQLLSERLTYEYGAVDLIVSFRTVPGGGVFEATVSRESSSGPWKISGSVSRLNLYGYQSHCVSDLRLAMYCYCVNATRDSQFESKTVNVSVGGKAVV